MRWWRLIQLVGYIWSWMWVHCLVISVAWLTAMQIFLFIASWIVTPFRFYAEIFLIYLTFSSYLFLLWVKLGSWCLYFWNDFYQQVRKEKLTSSWFGSSLLSTSAILSSWKWVAFEILSISCINWCVNIYLTEISVGFACRF